MSATQETRETPAAQEAGEARRPRPARAPGARGGSAVPGVLLGLVICVVMLFPVYAMVVVAFTPRSDLFDGSSHLWPDTLTLANFRGLFADFPIGTWFTNSLVVAGLTTAISVAVNLAAGYAFAKLRFPLRGVLFVLVLSTLMIPAQAVVIPQFRVVTGLDLFGTFWAVILPSASSALGIFLARQFFAAIPDELLEAARLDGAGTVRTFVSVVLPLSKPLLAVMTLLAFMNQWNDFLWPLITLRAPDLYTLPVSLRFLQGQYDADYGAMMAMSLLSSLPLVVLFLFLQRYFVQGLARTGIR